MAAERGANFVARILDRELGLDVAILRMSLRSSPALPICSATFMVLE